MRAGWAHWRHTWVRALARGELLAVMWRLSSRRLPDWVLVLPWVEWLLERVSVAWPWLGQQPEMRLVRWGLGWLRWRSLLLLSGDVVGQWLRHWASLDRCAGGVKGFGLLMGLRPEAQPEGCVVQGKGEAGSQEGVLQPLVEERRVEGGCRVQLQGEFYLAVKDDDPFRPREMILFLRRLEGPTERWGSRAMRDGRRPLVAQQPLAALRAEAQPEAWLGVPQPDISR